MGNTIEDLIDLCITMDRNDYVAAIESLQQEITRLREEAEWISVEDRLPENHQRVLANNGRKVQSGYYREPENAFVSDSNWSLLAVTHWKPLPPPPNNGE